MARPVLRAPVMKAGQESLARNSARAMFDERDAASADTGRILLAEDDPGVRRVTLAILQDLGYQVDAFASGSALLAAIERDKLAFELLLTDFDMPGMNGYELARRLSALKPSVKILLTSGKPEESLLDGPLPEDWPAFIAKPFSFDSLERKLREILAEPTTSLQPPPFDAVTPSGNARSAVFRAVTTQR